MAQQVGAVAVVVVVRDHHAQLVQVAGPAQFAHRIGIGLRRQLAVQRQRHHAHPLGLRHVHLEALLQLAHRVVAHVAVLAVARGMHAVVEVDDHALAQRAAGRLQVLDAEVRGQRVQDGQATGDHRAAVFLQAGQVQLVDVSGADALLDQPAQALGRDAAVGDAAGGQQLRHRAGGAR